MKKKNPLLCLSLFLSAGVFEPLSAAPNVQMQSYENRTVGQIDVKVENLPKGDSFDRQTVLTALRTRQGDPFSQYVFDQDLKSLADKYDRVEPVIHVEGSRVDITLKVWLRPVIQAIDWDGNDYLKTKALQKELNIKPGTTFNRVEFNRAFNKVKELYIKKGYFESKLSYKLVPIADTQEVRAVIKIDEGRSGKVEDIVFQGFTSDEESAVINRLYTKKYSKLTSWFTGKGQFNEEALEQDRLAIFDLLQNKGYADAKVKIELLESPSNGKIIVDISTEKGPLYHFGEVSFEGNILFDDEKIEPLFSARPDGVYSPEKLRRSSEAIKELYGRKGHIDTSVTFETQLNTGVPIYNAHFQITEGSEYRIGMIRIIGNVQTDSRVILRESLLVPGETFDSLKLKNTQVRLERMNFFKGVNVYAVRTQDDLSLGDNYRDIYIEVEESQTGNISLFGGFSSADNIFGGLDLTERNFNIAGFNHLSTEGASAFRGGGEFLRMRASYGPRLQNYLVSWVNPFFLDTRWQLGFEFNAGIKGENISKHYDINTLNFSTSLSYPINAYWTYGFTYQVKLADINAHVGNKQEDKQIDRASGVLSGVGAAIGYNSVDHPMKPHRGLNSKVSGEVVGLGGNFNFFRTSFANAYYLPLWTRGYMRYRADVRFLFPFGKTPSFEEVPVSERFFLGGVNSIRGYRDFAIGPQYTAINSNQDTVRTPKGGISSTFLSLEYIQEIASFLDVFAFMDGGYVSDNPFSFDTLRLSYGLGCTINVLGQMPVTIGYGIPLNPQFGDQEQRFFFSLGGQF